MTGALKFEWVRIKTIRSSYWMSAMAIVFTAGITTDPGALRRRPRTSMT